MGADYAACLVVGVRYDEIVREETRVKTVTGYHEITGQPYQKAVTAKTLLLLDKESENPVHDCAQAGLSLHTSSADANTDWVIGLEVARVWDSGEALTRPIKNLAQITERCAERLKSLGYTGTPEMFLMLYVSV